MDLLSFLLGLILGIILVSLLAFSKIKQYKRGVALDAEARHRTEEVFLLLRGGYIVAERDREKLKQENKSMLAQKLKAWGIPNEM